MSLGKLNDGERQSRPPDPSLVAYSSRPRVGLGYHKHTHD